MSNVVPRPVAETIFSEIINSERTPIVQIDASNGLREDVEVLESGASGTVEDSQYVLKTGTASDAFVSVLSTRIARHRSGQQTSCRFSALFETSAADSAQGAGFFNDSQGFIFGYDGTEFGVCRFHDGRSELQYLQVTSAATGSETATITVDGTAYSVPLTSGSVNHNAWEIANSLQSQVGIYDFTSNQDTVTALDKLARPAGAFAFSSATATATWTQDVAGIRPIQEWIPQSSWDNPPSWGFDPSKGNIYQITYYFGYGGVQFSIGNVESGVVEVVHTEIYANAATVPFVFEPSFRIGWVIQHSGNITPLTVKGSDSAAFTDGEIRIDERSRGKAVVEVGLTNANVINLVSIRNRISFNRKNNRITNYPKEILVGGQHNKTILFYLQINTSFTGDMEFSYVDEKNSNTEFSFSGATLNLDGRDLGIIGIRDKNSIPLNIADVVQYLNPGETLSIGARLFSGSGGEGDAAIYWLEDQ